MTTQEMIDVMKAYMTGAKIECRHRGHDDWPITSHPQWDWINYEYRVARAKLIEPVTIRSCPKWIADRTYKAFMIIKATNSVQIGENPDGTWNVTAWLVKPEDK